MIQVTTKKEQIDALRAHDRVFGITSETVVPPKESGFSHANNILYKIEFYEVQGDSVIPRHCHLVVANEGKKTEDARWFGGEPVNDWEGKDLCGRVMESELFQSQHGKVLDVRADCVIASVFKEPDTDGVEEEITVRIFEEDGKMTSRQVRVVTTPPLQQ